MCGFQAFADFWESFVFTKFNRGKNDFKKEIDNAFKSDREVLGTFDLFSFLDMNFM